MTEEDLKKYISASKPKPELVATSIGNVLKYTFKTYKEMDDFFLRCVSVFSKTNTRTKAIGKNLYVWKRNIEPTNEQLKNNKPIQEEKKHGKE